MQSGPIHPFTNQPAKTMETCQIKKRTLVDVKLVAEPPDHLFRYRYNITPKQKEEILKGWVRDFEDFIRDHRSCDPVTLYVEGDYKDLCSNCEEEWETAAGDGPECCASCGAILEAEPVAK